MRRAYLLITDSGGIQEEGPSLGKPVLAYDRAEYDAMPRVHNSYGDGHASERFARQIERCFDGEVAAEPAT
jgi:UDP-N-acetylglucosamine 2-epimerase